jgi:hypothetical protein
LEEAVAELAPVVGLVHVDERQAVRVLGRAGVEEVVGEVEVGGHVEFELGHEVAIAVDPDFIEGGRFHVLALSLLQNHIEEYGVLVVKPS